jgi:serine/threonine-protein kinase
MTEAEKAVFVYLRRLESSRLVSPQRLEQALDAFEQRQGPLSNLADVDALADFLIAEGCLTRWQHRKLNAGRHSGFFLANYKLLAHIGSGGMSEVYLAEHVRLARRVAIKILPVDRVKQGSYLERFQVEARASAMLDHPNLVRIHDFGNVGALHYLVMEYIDGDDLAARVRNEGPLPISAAVEIIAQAAEGLQHAHAKGLVHRDVKPSNLIQVRGGCVKVLDLGLALVDQDEIGSLTARYDEGILGTADYLAPEQVLDSHAVDARSDIYSLGCTLYFLLSGRPPFPKGTVPQKMLAHLKREPVPVSNLRLDVPEALRAIVAKMMAKDRKDRYRSCREVAAALRSWSIEVQGSASGLRATDTAILGGSQVTQVNDVVAPDVLPNTPPASGQPVPVARTSQRRSLSQAHGYWAGGIAVASLAAVLAVLSGMPARESVKLPTSTLPAEAASGDPFAIDSKAALVVVCGHVARELARSRDSYGAELLEGARYDSTTVSQPFAHGWRAQGELRFAIRWPSAQAGIIRLLVPLGEAPTKFLVDGRAVPTSRIQVGETHLRVDLTIESLATVDGRTEVVLSGEGDSAVQVTRIEVISM